MKNSNIVRIFALCLLFAEFLTPALLPDAGSCGSDIQTPICLHPQKKVNALLSYFAEESNNNEEERQHLKANHIFQDIHFLSPASFQLNTPVQVIMISLVSHHTSYNTHPPIYTLHRALLI